MEIYLLPGAEAEVYSYVNKEQCEELVRYALARPEDDPLVRPGRARWRLRRGGRWTAATAGGSTSAATPRAGPISWKSTPCRACIRSIPTCRSSAASWAFPTST